MCGFSLDGSDLKSVVKCPRCGALCEETVNFCDNCGANLKNNFFVQIQKYEYLFNNIFKVQLYNSMGYRFSLSKLFGFSMFILYLLLALGNLYSDFGGVIYYLVLAFFSYGFYRIIGFIIRKLRCSYYESHSDKNNFNDLDSNINNILDKFLYVTDNSIHRLSKSKFIGFLVFLMFTSMIIAHPYDFVNSIFVIIVGLIFYGLFSGCGFIYRKIKRF